MTRSQRITKYGTIAASLMAIIGFISWGLSSLPAEWTPVSSAQADEQHKIFTTNDIYFYRHLLRELKGERRDILKAMRAEGDNVPDYLTDDLLDIEDHIEEVKNIISQLESG